MRQKMNTRLAQIRQSLEPEFSQVQKTAQRYTPWMFAASLVAKLVLIGLFFFAPPNCANAQTITAGEQEVLVKNIETYLNNITTMESRFTQLNSDGTIDSGKFYLWRPGRLRFEYDAPKSDYIVADGLLIHYWDNGIKNYSNATIGSTLADFLLRKKISLSGDAKVTSLRRPQAGKLVLTMVQKDNPEGGDVRLLLNESPMQLTKWRVTDGVGNITETELLNPQNGMKLNASLFRFKPPKGYDAEWKNTR